MLKLDITFQLKLNYMELTSVLTYAFLVVAAVMIFAVGIPFLIVMSKGKSEPEKFVQKVPPVNPQEIEAYELHQPQYSLNTDFTENESAPAQIYSMPKMNTPAPRSATTKYHIINANNTLSPAKNTTKAKTWKSNWN